MDWEGYLFHDKFYRLEYENSVSELRNATESEFQFIDRAMIAKDEIIGTKLGCGRKIKGKKFATTSQDNPLYFKTPKLMNGKYPKKVK